MGSYFSLHMAEKRRNRFLKKVGMKDECDDRIFFQVAVKWIENAMCLKYNISIVLLQNENGHEFRK